MPVTILKPRDKRRDFTVDRATCLTAGCSNPSRTRSMCHVCYMRWHARQTGYGRFESQYVDAGPVREHVQQLRDCSMSYPAIAAAAGVSVSAVRSLMSGRRGKHDAGPSRRAMRTVASSLLAVRVPVRGVVTVGTPGGCQVDATGTRRRLRSLVASGYEQGQLAGHLGWSRDTVSRVITGRSAKVTARSHREVEALFLKLQLVPGTSVRARERARRNGWALPLQWDEGTIDDPGARPVACRARSRAA